MVLPYKTTKTATLAISLMAAGGSWISKFPLFSFAWQRASAGVFQEAS